MSTNEMLNAFTPQEVEWIKAAKDKRLANTPSARASVGEWFAALKFYGVVDRACRSEFPGKFFEPTIL